MDVLVDVVVDSSVDVFEGSMKVVKSLVAVVTMVRVTCLVVDGCKRQNSSFSSSLSSSDPGPIGSILGMSPAVGIGPVPGCGMHVSVGHAQGVVVGFGGPKLMVRCGSGMRGGGGGHKGQWQGPSPPPLLPPPGGSGFGPIVAVGAGPGGRVR